MITADDIEAMRPDMIGPSVLGITGQAGSGKTTAADYLVSNGWKRVKMAGPLKDMMRAIGLTDRHIEGDLKEVPCDLLCGKTPRHAMQTIGTEWGRNLVGSNIWVNIARSRILDAMQHGYNVVVDDVRFANEAETIRGLGGLVLSPSRCDMPASNHASEKPVDADLHYKNSGTIAELHGYMAYVFNPPIPFE
jgi:hypothetical protein